MLYRLSKPGEPEFFVIARPAMAIHLVANGWMALEAFEEEATRFPGEKNCNTDAVEQSMVERDLNRNTAEAPLANLMKDSLTCVRNGIVGALGWNSGGRTGGVVEQGAEEREQRAEGQAKQARSGLEPII
jgi:hypothetical protein